MEFEATLADDAVAVHVQLTPLQEMKNRFPLRIVVLRYVSLDYSI